MNKRVTAFVNNCILLTKLAQTFPYACIWCKCTKWSPIFHFGQSKTSSPRKFQN